GVRGVHHDSRAELAANRARGRFRGVGRAQHVADFANGLVAFVNQGDALFRALLIERRGVTLAGRPAGHEFDDVFKLMVAGKRAEQVAQRLFFSGRDFDTEFLFDKRLGFGGDGIVEPRAQDFTNRAVKFHRLGRAHAMHFDSDNVKAGARKEVYYVAGSPGREAEIVGLDQNQRALRFFVGRIDDGIFDQTAIGLRI